VLLPLQLNGLNLDSGTAVAVITGTADDATEADIVSGDRTIIITLTNDTWVAEGATFNAQRQNIIDGLDSAQSEALGWNNVVRDAEDVTAVVRTSDTVVTITLTAAPTYDITANEVITVTVPASALVTSSEALTATPTVDISFVQEATTGGRTRRRRRYSVEIDGEFIAVNTIDEAVSLLTQVRELAEESAVRDVTTPVTPKPPRVKIKTGSGNPTTSKVLQREVRKTQKAVNRAYIEAAKRIAQAQEISELMIKKLREEEDEEAIIALLM